MHATQLLCKALPSATAATTTTSRAAGTRAVAELTVYLRAMKAAQRRWTREISAHESHVRRLMLVEEQYRERLRQEVLKGTHANLKYLTNTDLMAVSQFVSPPSVETFLAYDIPAEQINGFGVYVMGCLGADPNRLRVPLPVLLADLSSAWAILPPSKRDAFTELGDIFRAHVPPRASPATGKRNRRAAVHPTATTAKAVKATKKRAGSAATRTSAHRRLRAAANTETAKTTAASQQRAGRLRSNDVVARAKAHRASATTIATTAAAAATAAALPLAPTASAAASTTAMGHDTTSGAARRRTGVPGRHVVQMETDEMEAFARQLPDAEYTAFCAFAHESLREMELALGASIIPVRKQRAGRAAGVAAHSLSLPRGVSLFMKEWLPIAAEEWQRKTRRQKSFYLRSS